MTPHDIVSPITPSQLLRHYVSQSGWSLDATALHADMPTRRLRKMCDGGPIRIDDVGRLSKALGRFFPALWNELYEAERRVSEWRRADIALAKERSR